MPDPAVMEVWALLQSRRDATNILREIVGDYALSIIGKPPDILFMLSFRLLVWTKVLFDMQRTYLQNVNPSTESLSRLVDPNTLFMTIRYILDIRFKVYNLRVGFSEEYLFQRRFIAGVLLSGLRALLLRGEGNYSARDIEDMQAQITVWQEAAQKFGLETAILDKCKYAVDTILSSIETGRKSDIKVDRPGCDILKLPDSEEPLFPLREKTDLCFDSELRELRDNNNERSFWVVFDMLWAAEGALIQKVVEVNKYAARLIPEKHDQRCLKAVLLDWCSGYYSLTEEMPEWTQAQALQTYLGHFKNFLVGRNAKLLASQVEISELSSRLGDSVDSWLVRASGIPREELVGKVQTVYLLNCPRLHVVPVHILQGLMDFTEGSNLLETHFMCPQCDDKRHLVQRARRIEPLDELSEAVNQIVNRFSEAQHLVFADSSIEDIRRTTTTGPSPVETRRQSSTSSMPQPSSSGSQSTDDTIPSKSGSNRTGIFAKVRTFSRGTFSEPKSPKTKVATEPLPTSHRFSVDGRTLLLWTEGGNFIFTSPIPEIGLSRSDSTLTGRRYVIEDARHVAGGTDLIAAVSGNRRLLVFSLSTGDVAVNTAVDGVDAIKSIAVCLTDKFVAVGLQTRVIIWNIQNLEEVSSNDFTLPEVLGHDIESQMISFSRDGSKVITATRNNQGTVQLTVCDEKGREIWPQRRTWITSKDMENQMGVSSVFYDNNKDYAIVTAFINEPYHVVHSESAPVELRASSRDLSKFQAAAQSPSESKFTLADLNGQLYTLDTRTRQFTKGTKRFHRCRANSRDEMMTLAMPNDRTVHGCWNEDGKIFLVTVINGLEKDPIRIQSLN